VTDTRARSEGARTFYRILKAGTPAPADFPSNEARGVAPTRALEPEHARLWDGLSVYDSIAGARGLHRRSPQLGKAIAEIRLTDADSYRAERTGRWGGH
jgi:hypothetical protein